MKQLLEVPLLLALKRKLPLQHAVYAHPRSPHITLFRVAVSTDDFGGHLVRGPQQEILVHHLLFDSEPQVNDLHLEGREGFEHHVVQLDVPVDDALLVQVVESAQELFADGQSVCEREFALVHDQAEEFTAWAEFGDKLYKFGPLNDVDQLDDLNGVHFFQDSDFVVDVVKEALAFDVGDVNDFGSEKHVTWFLVFECTFVTFSCITFT